MRDVTVFCYDWIVIVMFLLNFIVISVVVVLITNGYVFSQN